MKRRRSYLAVTLHLIWATRNRLPCITADIEQRLYDYFAATARNKSCDILAIGGVENHVHILLTLPATLRISDLLCDLKGGSSHFIKEISMEDKWFEWQENYAAISVSPAHRKRIIAYIHNQKSHHAEGSIEEILERDSETYELT